MIKKLSLFLSFILLFSLIFSGCSVKTETSNGLKVNSLVFCSEIRGDRDYTEKIDKTYSLDETVYVYLELSNFTSKITDSKYEYWLILEVEVKDPNKNSIIERQKIVDSKIETDYEAPYLFVPVELNFPEGSPSGKYEVFLYAKDGSSNRQASISDTFLIE